MNCIKNVLQAQQACLDEERRTRTKIAKRLERVETTRRQETKHLRDELASLRQAAAEAEAGHREAVQQRDVQLVVAESKAAAQRSQLEQQEQELRRMQEQIAVRERELSIVHEERMNLELKQQQLRYDRRLQVCEILTSLACVALNVTAAVFRLILDSIRKGSTNTIDVGQECYGVCGLWLQQR